VGPERAANTVTGERDVDRDRLEAVLRAAGEAHHAAFADTDGDDPEWALWYARHVIDEVREALHRPDLPVSRLVWAFVSCDETYSAGQPGLPWYRFYADCFIRELEA
jgi:hypothetical protein